MANETNAWRNEAAKQVWDMRDSEQKGYIKRGRSGAEYVCSLHGVLHLFKYATTIVKDDSKLFLDLGAGNTKGTSQLAQTFGTGLKFEATVLKRDPNILRYLGFGATHSTTFESLRGLEYGFVGAMSVYGLGYANNPELAIDKLDSILVPGAVIKSNFMHPDLVDDKITFKTHNRFSTRLHELGYDIAVADCPEEQTQIMVAVKSPTTMSASQLMSADLSDYVEQESVLKG